MKQNKQIVSPKNKAKQVKVTKPKMVAAKKQAAPENKPKPFPVVGIGASAGGLEAFSTLLQHLPTDLGMAYVYVQHLSPDHESLLPEILERKTKMKVCKAKNNMELEKDKVFVIPANHGLSISDGKLKLETRAQSEKVFHSIDLFLTHLASVYKENAIGILLSGTATDGTLGLKAIKDEGGITFAQDETARYEAMPHHAAQMGYADFVMSPERIARELASIIKHPYAGVISENEFLRKHDQELRKILQVMHNKCDVDFSYYKQTTIHRRIMRRMLLNHLNDLKEYGQLLKKSNTEVNALYHDLLISVTSFFRDPNIYHALKSKIFPAIVKDRKQNSPLRIWIPGCATGEEAVSTAIVLLEYLGEKALSTPIQIFATDLNERGINRARTGIYNSSALQNVSPDRLNKFFVKINSQYQVVKSIRDICIFATHDVIKDPPFSKMDIISCQNLLIYLEAEPQQRIMQAFHYALKPTGFLLLGKSESIGSSTNLFTQENKELKIYTKRATRTPLQLDFSRRSYTTTNFHEAEDEEKIHIEKFSEIDLEKESDKLLLTQYVPASVLVNKDLEIIRFRGATSRYLEPATGKASLNLMKMVKEELAYELRIVIHNAKKQGRVVKKEGVQIGSNGSFRELSIEVVPIKGNGKDIYFLVIFRENSNTTLKISSTSAKQQQLQKNKRMSQLEDQLKEARQSMKIMSEEFDATREELQSANEEVLSSNEELQSINEELETSKEELQSTNEELSTINDELHTRNLDLKEASQYADAILETMHESLLLLDRDLRIKKANKGFYDMFKVTPEKTEGFYLFELGNKQWDIPELHRQLKMVQSKDIHFANFEVEHEFNGIGRKTMSLNAQKIPTAQGREVMIILAVHDITARKEFEEQLVENEKRFKVLLQNAFDIITIIDENGTIKYESPAIKYVLGYTPEERVGRNIFSDSIVHPEDRNIKEQMLKRSIADPTGNFYAEFRLRHKNGSYRTIDAICRNMIHDKKIGGIIATYRDITDRKILEQQKDEFIGVASHELKTPVTSIKAYTQILQEMFIKVKDKHSADLLGKMDAQVDRLTTLIVDLLDFTRLEGGKLKFREENYDLNGLILEISQEMQRTTRRHKIETKLGRSVKMWGDRFRTGQVITNLVSNAIKYSPQAKKIIITGETKNKKATICIRDFGIGIETKMIGKVFDRYFRVTESTLNTFPGLGLGLYIASEIVKRQGGTISVKSTVGKGSTFCFTLPVKK